MTIEEARKEIINSITSIYEKGEADNIAEIVTEHITRWSRLERVLNKDVPLSSFQKTSLKQVVDRLQQHEPIQYIINEAWFAGMRFYVDKSVLIPRPETEELVEWIVKEFRIKDEEFRILDVGTGSGCIAIALKKKLPNAEVWACDISDEALTVARMNADALNTAIDFVPLNFLDREQRKQLPEVDLIVSNPPYVPQQDKNEMRKNVVGYEPGVALFVPDSNPLVFYEVIADFGKEKLTDGGKIYVEIHENLGEQVKQLFQSKAYKSVDLKKDLQGKDRMIKSVSN